MSDCRSRARVRTRCSVLHAAAQSRDRTKHRSPQRPRLCSALRREGAAHCAASGAREATPMLTLYFAPGSSSMAVHIALHEIGVAFDGRPMSFKNNDMGSPGYLALNPEGKVP